jgi:NAD(P)-dependent dehydrogenase (short-subunit alcohol dehydrogenase family)
MSETKTVLLRGEGAALVEPVATALLDRGATVALLDMEAGVADRIAGLGLPGRVVDLGTSGADEEAPFQALAAAGHQLDAVVHMHLPTASTDEAALRGYAGRLRPMLNAALDYMQSTGRPGIVVNQFLMPTLLADHGLAAAMVEARNAVTGLTRFACVKYGRAGLRVCGLLVGLLELPSLRALASERVNAAKTPLGRWIRPDEVAGTIAFLGLDSGYITGQMLVLDGGMTGGINGV